MNIKEIDAELKKVEHLVFDEMESVRESLAEIRRQVDEELIKAEPEESSNDLPF